MRKGRFILWGIIGGVVAGALLGGAFPRFGASVKFIGQLFLHALMMMVVPLVAASMITGVAALGDVRKLGGIGVRTLIYFASTTGLAVIVGLLLVNAVQPGKGLLPKVELPGARWTATESELLIEEGSPAAARAIDDRFEIVLSGGARAAIAQKVAPGTRTIPVRQWVDEGGRPISPPTRGEGLTLQLRVAERVQAKQDASPLTVIQDVLLKMVPTNLIKSMAETDVLPVIVFSLLFGAVLTTMGGRGKVVLDFFAAVNDAIMVIIQLLMFAAPIGIFALIAGRLGEAGGWGDFLPELRQLGSYAFCVVAGLLIHGAITLPLILKLVGKRSPLGYVSLVGAPLTTAFSTASSSATLPVSLRSAENAGVDERAASFVLPLGATINMDGTALYEAVAAMFIAQVYGIELGPAQQLIIFVTATLAAVGAAGIPEAGLVTMIIVLKAVDLPVEGISLLLVIDWFLDRCRTAVNVWGDLAGAAIIDRLEKKVLGGAAIQSGP